MLQSKHFFTSFLLLLSMSLNADSLGSLLFHGNCVTCHFETKDDSAPAIITVRENYLRAFPKKDDFVKAMSEWVIKPNKETSIMLNAVKKYKLMPHLGYEEEVLKDITAYIYETDFTKKHEGHN